MEYVEKLLTFFRGEMQKQSTYFSVFSRSPGNSSARQAIYLLYGITNTVSVSQGIGGTAAG